MADVDGFGAVTAGGGGGGGPAAMAAFKEQAMQMMLASMVHLGDKQLDHRMERYMHKRRNDGVWVINLEKTWQKLDLAARTIVAIENPQDVMVQSARPNGQRAVFKFAQLVGCKSLAGRYVPGTFTNQAQSNHFQEARLLLVSDPIVDHQPVKEASYVGVPTIALCGSGSPLMNVDIAVPCNNRGKHAIGVMYYILARLVLHMRGTHPVDGAFPVPVDLFFFRQPEEMEEGEGGEGDAGYRAGPPDAFAAGGGGGGGADTWGETWGGDEAAGAAGFGAGGDFKPPEGGGQWGEAPPAAGYGGDVPGFETAGDFGGAPGGGDAFGGGFGGQAPPAQPEAAPAASGGEWE